MEIAAPHLPTGHDLARLYSRAEVRACLAWSDEKLRRRLLKLPTVRPSGSGRGQQFTGTDIVALYRGGMACGGNAPASAGSRFTAPENSAGAMAGTSAAATCMGGGSKAASRPPSRLRMLLSDLETNPSDDPIVIPLHR